MRAMRILYLCALAVLIIGIEADKPCASRVTKQSVICVCNTTYCDEITREVPTPGHYVVYTSSEAGLRFHKTRGEMKLHRTDESCPRILELDLSKTYQTIEGFGGAVTDAAAIHWKNLTDHLRDHFINSYFSAKGIEYNMLRVPIGGCDFSTHAYAYNELPWNDTQLTNYTLAIEDLHYKIPMMKRIMNASTSPVHVIATTWSPPAWMKTNEKMVGFSRLKPEFYQTYADYHAKFVQKYADNDIPIWGITTTNEPQDGTLPVTKFQTLGWTAKAMGKWISENLGPTFRDSPDLENVKIIAVDDLRYTLPYFFNEMIAEHPKALQYIDGVGVHFYADKIIPPEFLEVVTRLHPEKFVINTEACEGSMPWQTEKVSLGSWSRARHYISDIITDLNYNLVGWLDWNLCLDKQGGPNWVENFVDSPIIVYPEVDEFIKQPMFYAMGHFSKWIPRGSRRIKVKERKGFFAKSVKHVAFSTPQNTTVMVVYNDGAATTVNIKLRDHTTSLDLDAHSISTIEFGIV